MPHALLCPHGPKLARKARLGLPRVLKGTLLWSPPPLLPHAHQGELSAPARLRGGVMGSLLSNRKAIKRLIK